MNINVYGTKRVLDLCSSLEQLEVFVHVSTCYANCDHDVIEERVYPQQMKPEQVMQMVEWLDDEALAAVETKMLGNKPNTYTFTKSLAEVMVKNFHQATITRFEQKKDSHNRDTNQFEQGPVKRPFSVCIIRPSIVVASLKEPFPGWTDTFNGPSSMIVAGSRGILRSIYLKHNCRINTIPVDIVVNTILSATWYSGVFKPDAVMVYNCALDDRASFTGTDFGEIVRSHFASVPFTNCVRYPRWKLRENWAVHRASMLLQHYVPAYIADKALELVGSKPRFVEIYNKLIKLQHVYTYFLTHDWNFELEGVQRLKRCLSDEDCREFCIDVSHIDWSMFCYNYMRGLRNFIQKGEHDKSSSSWLQFLYIFDQVQNIGVTLVLYKAFGIGDLLASVYDTVVKSWF